MSHLSHAMKRRVTVLASMISILLIASVAFAAWTANGAGNGYAEAGSHQALTTDAIATVSEKLFPTNSADVQVTINNPNSYDVIVTDINGTTAITSDVEGCTTANHGVSFADQAGEWRVPAGDEATVTLNNAASMSNASDNACQTALFTIPVEILAGSAAPAE